MASRLSFLSVGDLVGGILRPAIPHVSEPPVSPDTGHARGGNTFEASFVQLMRHLRELRRYRKPR